MPTNIYTIYKHTSPSGKYYIGVTKHEIETRWKSHCRLAKNKPTTYFHHAINKYGSGNFISEVLMTTESELFAYEMEIYLIKYFGANICTKGYNLADGGNRPRSNKDGNSFIAIDTNGNSYKDSNMKNFCKVHNLNYGSFKETYHSITLRNFEGWLVRPENQMSSNFITFIS